VSSTPDVRAPLVRTLRGFAFDPSLSLRLDTAVINAMTYRVPWEELEPGPVGEYVEVIDVDPTCDVIYVPVNLSHPHILATDGLEPSESNPQFHQQMVYAVAMTTIRNFERALGRKILWSPRRIARDGHIGEEYVRRLRIHPHALREANAYYSPAKKALLFGYFNAEPLNPAVQAPGSTVFTCLSHDIVAHETTHAMLDGLHGSYTLDTNRDVLAFHEAFADIVALFQHFSFPDVLRHQIARTRGNLESQNLLGQLAQEFGLAIGGYGALREAIGVTDRVTGQWSLRTPDPADYETVVEPHARGAILVAAVFDAFLAIYKSRIADLLRIATDGRGVLPAGAIHPDLVARLADEASKSAAHVLRMCIRALDYCPPVDVTFGDFLRAVISADVDLVPDDREHYRVAFIEAFRARGIHPEGVRTLSVENLVYGPGEAAGLTAGGLGAQFAALATFLREFREVLAYTTSRAEVFALTRTFITGGTIPQPDGSATRIRGLHQRLFDKFDDFAPFESLTGLVFGGGWEQLGVATSSRYGGGPSFQVRNLSLASRVTPDEGVSNQIALSLVQRAGARIVHDDARRSDPSTWTVEPCLLPDDAIPQPTDVELLGSTTVILDLDTLRPKHVITKPLIDLRALRTRHVRQLDRARIIRQYLHQHDRDRLGMSALMFRQRGDAPGHEPFALLHREPGERQP
jgi:hypothetical protein